MAGYFDNAEAFHEAAVGLDQSGAHGVYFTLNPVKPELLARSCNRLDTNISTTGDEHVRAIRWLPIDVDPVRVSGISSTQEELDAARMVAEAVAGFLEEKIGFPSGIRAMSGNGWHLLYRMSDREVNPEIVRMVRSSLAVLAKKFDTPAAKVDTGVFNPARIWKLYGTVSRKGDSTPDRPHRRSRLYSPRSLEDVPIANARETRSAAGPED